MTRKWLKGSITLSLYKSVITERIGKDKKPVRGIFIPFDANYLTVKEKAVYAPISVAIADEADRYDQIAMITQDVNSEIFKAATDEQKEKFKKMPILGNLRDFSHQSSPENQVPEISADDDLPF